MIVKEAGLRSADVCRLSGATYRQLDYWARANYLHPSIRSARGPGTQRVYSQDDVVIATALVAVSLLRDQQLGLVAETLRQGQHEFTIGKVTVSLRVDVEDPRTRPAAQPNTQRVNNPWTRYEPSQPLKDHLPAPADDAKPLPCRGT